MTNVAFLLVFFRKAVYSKAMSKRSITLGLKTHLFAVYYKDIKSLRSTNSSLFLILLQ